MFARYAATVTLAVSSLGMLAACSSGGPTENSRISRVVITPTMVTILALDDTVQLTATATDAVGRAIEGAQISWQSSASQIASVDQTGVVTSHRNGPAMITATADGVSGQAQITVVQSADSVEVTPNMVVLTAQGVTRQLTAEAWDANGNRIADAVFDWISLNPSVAQVDGTGLVTSVSPGSAVINADAGTALGTASVLVTEAVATVDVQPANDTLVALGDTVRFEAIARNASGGEISGVQFTWTSEDEDVAVVDDSGLATAEGNGMSTITASVGGVDGTATLVVEQRAASVSMTPSSLPTFEALGDTVRLSAEAFDANGNPITGAQFVWSSTDALVASVDATGLVTIEGNGSATIRAQVDGVEGTVGIDVSQVVSSVTIQPDPLRITALNETVQLQATAFDANGFEVEGKAFGWQSNAPSIATVNAAGRVTSVANGIAEVTATTDGVTGQVSVIVQQEAASVVVDPDLVAMAVGDVVLLTATAFDSNGFEIDDVSPVWESSNENVATVTPLGSVRAIGPGNCLITAFVGSVQGEAQVFVELF